MKIFGVTNRIITIFFATRQLAQEYLKVYGTATNGLQLLECWVWTEMPAKDIPEVRD